MKAFVDQNVCNGCGDCVEVCPDVFVLNESETVAVVKVVNIPPDKEEACQKAMMYCPVDAITFNK